MDFAEIVSIAVEAKVKELVTAAITPSSREDYPRSNEVERAVQLLVGQIAQEEVKKHENAIRAAIAATLNNSPQRIEISAYTKIVLPPESAY